MTTAAEIVDPWLNGDPCEGCTKCDKLCLKLKERIESVLKFKNDTIRDNYAIIRDNRAMIQTLQDLNKKNNDWGTTLFAALENLYNDYAEYYPSSVTNSPAMKAAYELIHEEDESEDE